MIPAKPLKIAAKNFIFSKVTDLQPVTLLKIEHLSDYFQGFYLHVRNTTRTSLNGASFLTPTLLFIKFEPISCINC